MENPKASLRAFKSKPWLGLRRIAPFQTEHNAEGKRVRIFWVRLIIWALTLGCLGWTSLTAGAYFYVKYARDYTTVQYKHILFYPWQVDEYRHARCEFLLAKGKAEILEEKYLEAFTNIRLGLLEVPEDTEARINIIQFYIALKRNDLAEQTFNDGIKYNIEKMDYVIAYFKFLFSLQQDERAIEVSRKLQATEIKNANVRHALIMAEASGHFFRGRYTTAKTVLREYNKQGTRDGSLVMAQILWEQDRKQESVALLGDLNNVYPADDEIYLARINYLHKLGRYSDIRTMCVLRQVEHPDRPQAFIDEVLTLNPDTESLRWSAAISEVFIRFPSNPTAMNGLAEIAASKGQVELAWRIYKQCKAHDIPWLISATAVLKAHVAAKRYAETITAAQTIVTENEEWAKTDSTQLDAYRSIANYGLGDKSLSELQLQNYLNDKQANAANFFAVAEQMARVGALDQARTILTAAVRANSLDQASLTRLVELDLEQLDTLSLVTNTDRLLVMRKPEPDFLRKIQSTLQSDRYIFEGSDALLQKISARLAQKEEG